MSKSQSDKDDRRFAGKDGGHAQVTVVDAQDSAKSTLSYSTGNAYVVVDDHTPTKVFFRGSEQSLRRGDEASLPLALNDTATSQAPPPVSTAEQALVSDLDLALAHFQRLELLLKSEHSEEYVTIDVVTGEYAIGVTGMTAVENFEAKFGTGRRTFTGHIGSTVW